MGKCRLEWTLLLPPWTTLSNCPSTNDLSAVLKPHIESVEKFELDFPVPKCESGFENYEISSLHHPLKAAPIGSFTLVNPKMSLCSARWGRAKVHLAFVQTQPRKIIYRFQVIQTSMDPSLAIFMLLDPYGVSSPPYIESKWNLQWWEVKSLTL